VGLSWFRRVFKGSWTVPGLMLTVTRIELIDATNGDSMRKGKVLAFPVKRLAPMQMAA
jgi:hypothetical protein